jgi:hypothetical protein
MIVVKFSTLRGGLWIEVDGLAQKQAKSDTYVAMTRCFKFDANGKAKYSFHEDLMSNDPTPRFYSHDYKEKDFVFC